MKDVIVFDIETKKSFDEVGGRGNLDKLGVSVLGAYSYSQNKYFAYEEHELDGFKDMLKDAEVLVGFNIKGFDIPVLEPYFSVSEFGVTPLDMMDDVVSGAGFRVSLDNLANPTLGITKSADGLQALQWYREGKIDEIKKYCLQDVKVTKELYEYGKKYGQVLFYSRQNMGNSAIPVSWGSPVKKDIPAILHQALNERKRVEIGYKSDSAYAKESVASAVDVYNIKGDSFEGFCHLRGGKKIFKIDKVVSAKITDNAYKIQKDVQEALF